MKTPNVVWTAVASVALAIGSALSAGLGNSEWVLALGLASISAATLASRER